MNLRTTLILLAIALAGLVYIKFYESKKPGTEEAQRQSRNVVNIDREKIDGVVIQNGEDKIDIRRRDNKWRLEVPIKDQADNALVGSVLSDLEAWQKDATIPAKELEADKNKLTEFGLNKPKLRVKLIGEGAPPEIVFGKD